MERESRKPGNPELPSLITQYNPKGMTVPISRRRGADRFHETNRLIMTGSARSLKCFSHSNRYRRTRPANGEVDAIINMVLLIQIEP
jgi:hypothetical protein